MASVLQTIQNIPAVSPIDLIQAFSGRLVAMQGELIGLTTAENSDFGSKHFGSEKLLRAQVKMLQKEVAGLEIALASKSAKDHAAVEAQQASSASTVPVDSYVAPLPEPVLTSNASKSTSTSMQTDPSDPIIDDLNINDNVLQLDRLLTALFTSLRSLHKSTGGGVPSHPAAVEQSNILEVNQQWRLIVKQISKARKYVQWLSQTRTTVEGSHYVPDQRSVRESSASMNTFSTSYVDGSAQTDPFLDVPSVTSSNKSSNQITGTRSTTIPPSDRLAKAPSLRTTITQTERIVFREIAVQSDPSLGHWQCELCGGQDESIDGEGRTSRGRSNKECVRKSRSLSADARIERAGGSDSATHPFTDPFITAVDDMLSKEKFNAVNKYHIKQDSAGLSSYVSYLPNADSKVSSHTIIDQLARQVDTLKADNVRKSRLLKDLRTWRLAEIENSRHDRQKAKLNADKLIRLQHEISSKDTALKTLRSALSEMKDNDKSRDVGSLESRLHECEVKCESYRNRSIALRAQFLAVRDRCGLLTSEKNELFKAIEKLEADKATVARKDTLIRSLREEREKERSEWAAEHEKSDVCVRKLELKLGKVERKCVALEVEVASLRRREKTATAEWEVQRREYARQLEQLSASKKTDLKPISSSKLASKEMKRKVQTKKKVQQEADVIIGSDVLDSSGVDSPNTSKKKNTAQHTSHVTATKGRTSVSKIVKSSQITSPVSVMSTSALTPSMAAPAGRNRDTSAQSVSMDDAINRTHAYDSMSGSGWADSLFSDAEDTIGSNASIRPGVKGPEGRGSVQNEIVAGMSTEYQTDHEQPGHPYQKYQFQNRPQRDFLSRNLSSPPFRFLEGEEEVRNKVSAFSGPLQSSATALSDVISALGGEAARRVGTSSEISFRHSGPTAVLYSTSVQSHSRDHSVGYNDHAGGGWSQRDEDLSLPSRLSRHAPSDLISTSSVAAFAEKQMPQWSPSVPPTVTKSQSSLTAPLNDATACKNSVENEFSAEARLRALVSASLAKSPSR